MTTLLGLTSGIGGALLTCGVFAFAVAVVALARGRVRWARLPNRAAGAVALAGAIVAMSIGGALTPAASNTAVQSTPQITSAGPLAMSPSPSQTSATTTPSPSTTTSATTTDPVTAAIDTAQPGTALALLGTLTVKGRGPMTGYSRAEFGAEWSDVDRNGCDQRNDTLRRDLRAITLVPGSNGCAVMTGTLGDPYTGDTVEFTRTSTPTSPVQIDHVVALADAWVKGAAGWDPAQRTLFANDTLNLAAVSATVNAAKGAGDAATWMPPAQGYRCGYVARQVAVKARYQLAVTAAERSAIGNTLTTCPTTMVPTVSVAQLGGFPLYQAPLQEAPPEPSPIPSSTPDAVQGVSPGAFCSPQGALGHTSKGTLMRCSIKPGDTRARWRAS